MNEPDLHNPELLLARLARHVAARPGALAYTLLDSQGTVAAQWTYAMLDQRVRSVAALIRTAARPGDRAMLLYPHGLEFVAGFLGCLAVGVIAVPAYPPRKNRKVERLRNLLADCTPAVILTTGDLLPSVDAAAAELALPRVLVTDGETDEPLLTDALPRIEANTVAFLQYTSGATGAPKGVVVTHDSLAVNEVQMWRGFDINPESSPPPAVASWLPLFHDMGLIGGVLNPLYVGYHSILLSPTAFLRNPLVWLTAISSYGCTIAGGPDFAFDHCSKLIREEQKHSLDLSGLKTLFNGAEPIRGETLDRFAAAFAACGFHPRSYFPCYGLAEAILFVSGGPAGTEPRRLRVDPIALEAGRVVPDSAGRAIVGCGQPGWGIDVTAVNPQTHSPAAPGMVGELWVRSPGLGHGYWHRPAESAAVFGAQLVGENSPYLNTGDLGFVHEGEVYVTGRSKDLLIIRGRNIYPQDVERVVEQAAPFIQPNGCAAFGIAGDGGEQVGLVIEADRALVHAVSRGGPEVEVVTTGIREAVAREFEVTVSALAIVRPGSFPRTSSGKVQRAACREGLKSGSLNCVHIWRASGDSVPSGRAASASPAAGGFRGDEVSLREILCKAVARYVHAEGTVEAAAIDGDSPLTALGLDSVGMASVATTVEKVLGINLAIDFLHEYPTINRAAEYLARRTHNGPVEQPRNPSPSDRC